MVDMEQESALQAARRIVNPYVEHLPREAYEALVKEVADALLTAAQLKEKEL